MSAGDVVRGLYGAFGRGNVGAVLGAMSPDIVWNEAENFPYADRNPYVGPNAVAEGVFGRIGADWDGFAVNVEELIEAGERVVALGRYTGANKKTGQKISAQFAHVWRVQGGKVASFQQYADTLQVVRASG